MKLKFDLHLPFKLPILDSHKVGSSYHSADFFIEFNTFQQVSYIEESEMPPLTKEATVITINYLPKKDITENLQHDELLRMTVLDSLHYINRFLDTIRAFTGLNHIYNITIADLPILLLINVENELYLYITQAEEITRNEGTLSKEEIVKAISTMKTYEDAPDIYLVDKFFGSAKNHIYKEQFLDAIIDFQTSFEIFIRNTHRLILTKNGESENTITDASKIPFRNVIEHHLTKYLKTNLNFQNPGKINTWYNNLYKLRNQIVHQGRIDISGEEAYEAYDSYVSARNFISDKLVAEGFLDAEGRVDLGIFKKNVKGSINQEDVIKRLKDLGIIDEGLEFRNPTVKNLYSSS
ncbi:hypothetical protein ACN6MY_11095 [Peribacillus sp. B-H-3]|uniref:hypothetical protein n=1 Tax=Peribacillus sp. B-H-3 TaxID=3400420 RepID=UPI003B020E9D